MVKDDACSLLAVCLGRCLIGCLRREIVMLNSMLSAVLGSGKRPGQRSYICFKHC